MELLRFSEEEFSTRYSRLQSIMAERRLDGLLLGTGVNLQYFSGFPSPGQSSSRPFLLLLSQRSNPTLIVQTGRAFEADRYSWVRDIRTYPRLSRQPTEILGRAIREHGLERGVIGMEWGHEMRSDVPTWEFLQFAHTFPEMRLVDGSDVIWKLRLIKSKEEVVFVRRACAITSAAFNRLFREIHEGMTEEEVIREFAGIQLEEGSSTTWAVTTSGCGNYDLGAQPPSSRRIRAGDMVWVDGGCCV